MPKKSEGSLDILCIEAFLAVMKNSSFAAAGEMIGCSQSTISKRIMNLESWLGGELFRREDLFTYPTNLAINFLGRAAKIMEALYSFREAVTASNFRMESEPDSKNINPADCSRECRAAIIEFDSEGPRPGWWQHTFGVSDDN